MPLTNGSGSGSGGVKKHADPPEPDPQRWSKTGRVISLPSFLHTFTEMGISPQSATVPYPTAGTSTACGNSVGIALIVSDPHWSLNAYLKL